MRPDRGPRHGGLYQRLSRIAAGADARFTLYDDDGTTNAYLKGGDKAELIWNDKAKTLTSKTKLPTGQAIAGLVQVVGQ